MQFHGNGLECRLLDFELRAEQFLLIFVLHACKLLFLPVLSALVEEEGSHDKSHQQQGKRGSDKNNYNDFLVLSRHKKAIVNDKYSKIFMKSRIYRITRMIDFSKLMKLISP